MEKDDCGTEPRISRRGFILSGAAVGLTGVSAGCLGGSGGPEYESITIKVTSNVIWQGKVDFRDGNTKVEVDISSDRDTSLKDYEFILPAHLKNPESVGEISTPINVNLSVTSRPDKESTLELSLAADGEKVAEDSLSGQNDSRVSVTHDP